MSEIAPVKVAMVGTGDGLVPSHGMVATTPASKPNLIITVVTPIAAIVIRAINNYLTTLVGLVAAGMTSDVFPVSDFAQLVILSAKLSIAGTAVGFGKDLITIFGKLETKYPLMTGNV